MKKFTADVILKEEGMKGFRRAKAHGGYFFIVERSEAIKMDTGNPLIGFPHVPTFHWNVVTPLPDPKEDSVKASDSNPERSRAPPAPAKGLSPLETRN